MIRLMEEGRAEERAAWSLLAWDWLGFFPAGTTGT
jgi:hypothetical protein